MPFRNIIFLVICFSICTCTTQNKEQKPSLKQDTLAHPRHKHGTAYEALVGGAIDMERFQRKYPRILKLAQDKREITLPADRRLSVGLDSPVHIKFLELISVGAFGAVMKARANGEEIAFKVLRPRSEDHLLEERQELIMMKYLSTYMDEVLKPKCGTKVHIFEVDGIEFRGIGMELFPFPTLVEYFQGPKNPACGLGAVVKCIRTIAGKNTDALPNPANLKGRMKYLQSLDAKTIWEMLYEALRNMWSLGVVHQDLHANNVLFDKASGRVRIIDFGMAKRAADSQWNKYVLGVCGDLFRIAYTFTNAVLFPRNYGSDRPLSSKHDQILNYAMASFTPVAAAIGRTGTIPGKSSRMRKVWESFRYIYGLEKPDQWPNERKVQEAAFDDIDWDFDDQGKVLRAHKKPNPISLKKIAEDQSPPSVITPNLAAAGEKHVASSNAHFSYILVALLITLAILALTWGGTQVREICSPRELETRLIFVEEI